MIVTNNRLQIIRGEDKTVVFKIRERGSNDPINLDGVTNITIKLLQANRQELVLDMVQLPAKKAKIEVQDVKIVADNAGGMGNSIVLVFDGIQDLDTVINEWNNNNPANTVSHNGNGDELFEGEFRLFGGLESYRAVDIDSDPLLGRVKLTLNELQTIRLRTGNNQSVPITIDWGYPPSGTRRIARFDNRLDVVNS